MKTLFIKMKNGKNAAKVTRYRIKKEEYIYDLEKSILESIKRKIYPSWDVQNLWSLPLAEKLEFILI